VYKEKLIILMQGHECLYNLQHKDYDNLVVAAQYKTDDVLNCCISSSDISGYHADFHEGHGTVRKGQGRGMACVN
jgi:hypothetical protein